MRDMAKKRRHAPRRPRCKTTGKVRYRDGHDATLALRTLKTIASRAEAEGGHHRIHVVRKYKCPHCKGWHLTSQKENRKEPHDLG